MQSEVLMHNNLLPPSLAGDSSAGGGAGPGGAAGGDATQRSVNGAILPPELQNWHDTMARLSAFVAKSKNDGGLGSVPLHTVTVGTGADALIIPHSSIESRVVRRRNKRLRLRAATLPPGSDLPLHPRAEKRASLMAAQAQQPPGSARSASHRPESAGSSDEQLSVFTDSDEDSDERAARKAREARSAAAAAERAARLARLHAAKPRVQTPDLEQSRKDLQTQLKAKAKREQDLKAEKRKRELSKQRKQWEKMRLKEEARREAAKRQADAERAKLALLNQKYNAVTPKRSPTSRSPKPKPPATPKPLTPAEQAAAALAAASAAAVAAQAAASREASAPLKSPSAGDGVVEVDVRPPSPSMLSPSSSVPNSPKSKARGSGAFAGMLSPSLVPLALSLARSRSAQSACTFS